jgi:hypothetical protein
MKESMERALLANAFRSGYGLMTKVLFSEEKLQSLGMEITTLTGRAIGRRLGELGPWIETNADA